MKANGCKGLRKVHWTPAMDALLGTTPDAKVAALLGIGLTTVYYRRVKLGVTAYACRFLVRWTPDMDSLLGTMSDVKLGERLGIATMTVWRRRKSLQILSVRGK